MLRDHHTHLASLFVLAFPLLLAGSAIPLAYPETEPLALKSGAAALPEAPEKALVVQYCDVCHGLDWITRSGGTEAGWADRLNRMIRSGATIPREQIPQVAAYLAKALPPRPAPPRGRLP